MIKMAGLLSLVALFFGGFFILDARHASSEKLTVIEQRISDSEKNFENWQIKEKIRKYEKRIEEIESQFMGKIIPKEWLDQINWIKEQIKRLRGELKK